MKFNVFFVSFCISLAFAGTIIYLIRKGKLKERYALLWLLMSLIMMVLSSFPSLLDRLAVWLDISYAPSLLYLLSIVAVLFVLLHLTISVSSLAERVVVLTQTLGLQEDRIHKLERKIANKAAGDSRSSGIEDKGQGISQACITQSSIPSSDNSYDQAGSSTQSPSSTANPAYDHGRKGTH
ncbi:DUF2304 domain-containing protein [Paenibacillus dakarensis]|uniref:DUF2304 domain-containing protein n=1 Tax=Paenibacillus dakarensis TaxID=1527293 RepID=UPI0009E72007|nr:DUF2304 domain-containing protein [Paenibacillus dakarensis]